MLGPLQIVKCSANHKNIYFYMDSRITSANLAVVIEAVFGNHWVRGSVKTHGDARVINEVAARVINEVAKVMLSF